MSYIIMGVSGSGKSTIGKLLADSLGMKFIDADDYHPEASIRKMSQGVPLSDADRQDWLSRLNRIIVEAEQNNQELVMACSALRETYRQTLQKEVKGKIKWVFLEGSEDLLQSRISQRFGHFMPGSLLSTQLDILEEPAYGLHVDISQNTKQIIHQIIHHFMDNTNTAAFGIIGMGVMGKSLALNLSGKGIRTAVFNRHVPLQEEQVAQRFAEEHPEQPLVPFEDLQLFVQSLEKPRRILLMVKAGAAVDTLLDQLQPLLDKGDLVMDGGNSHYLDTGRRTEQMQKQLLHFLGVGISGGEEGALKGPSLMPGGTLEGYRNVEKLLLKMAAKDKNGDPCCTYIGPEGAGHFVKMVHNGIEYAEMQLLAEVYQLMRYHLQLEPDEIVTELTQWQNNGLGSYLLEITISILQKKENNELLLDKILDAAEQKGTGGWSTVAALDLGASLDPIAAAVMARYLSAQKYQRIQASDKYPLKAEKIKGEKQECLQQFRQAYEAVRLVNHTVGFGLMQQASEEYGWQMKPESIARIWTNGCIIRSELMEELADILKQEPNMLLHPEIAARMKTCIPGWKETVAAGLKSNAALPVMSAALNYFLGFITADSAANLIQAQRDYFGAHTFRRKDKPADQYFHAAWIN